MTTDIAVRDTTAIISREKRTPDELIAEGKMQATALMKVVQAAGLSKDLGGSKPHLEVEAWQTIGRFNGFLTDIVWTRPVIEGGAKVGYEARAELVSVADGMHLIGAEASCFFDEELERKDGTTFKRWDNDYAVKSMAQTRAQSKLGRMAFAWVAVLAGYSGTPAEEMEGVRRNGAARPIVFPFGKHKDQAPAALAVEDLHKELAFWEKKAADETNPKFKANNERLVTAIREAIAEKTAKVETPAPEPPADTHAEKMKVLLDQTWAKVDELCQAVGWNNKNLRDHCSATFPGTKKRDDLNADQVAHLTEYLQKLIKKREDEKQQTER